VKETNLLAGLGIQRAETPVWVATSQRLDAGRRREEVEDGKCTTG
jgi:hypothetical protein